MMSAGWRRLAAFWAVILAVGAGGATTLEVMGPPQSIARPPKLPPTALEPAPAPAPVAILAPPAPVLPTPGLIRPPDSALLEPAPDFPDRFLPRRAADGRVSMSYYARAPEAADKRPKLGMLVVGLGQSESDTQSAITTLPGAVSLGVSPYTPKPDPLLASAREHGHEYLVTLPMESQGYPLNDSGPHALLTGADPGVNDRNLEWVLSRMQGEVGLTGASDGLRGERFGGSEDLLSRIRRQLAARGLLYADPRPGATVQPGTAVVSMVIDDPPDRASIDAKLSRLEQRARDGETMLGLVVLLRPVTIERIAAWARGLDSRGVVLTPVSALVTP